MPSLPLFLLIGIWQSKGEPNREIRECRLASEGKLSRMSGTIRTSHARCKLLIELFVGEHMNEGEAWGE